MTQLNKDSLHLFWTHIAVPIKQNIDLIYSYPFQINHLFFKFGYVWGCQFLFDLNEYQSNISIVELTPSWMRTWISNSYKPYALNILLIDEIKFLCVMNTAFVNFRFCSDHKSLDEHLDEANLNILIKPRWFPFNWNIFFWNNSYISINYKASHIWILTSFYRK